MSGNKHSGNRSGRTDVKQRSDTIAPRSPSEKVLKLVRKEPHPIDKLPPIPMSSWVDKRAKVLWARLGNRLLDHGMLTELDLDMLEVTVHIWRLVEIAFDEGDTRGAAVGKLTACLKSLGLSKDGRLHDAFKPMPGSGKGQLFNGLMQ